MLQNFRVLDPVRPSQPLAESMAFPGNPLLLGFPNFLILPPVTRASLSGLKPQLCPFSGYVPQVS